MRNNIPTTNNKMNVESKQQPEEQMVLRKDQKIQQLMMENTQLKRQLSQLISKTSITHTPFHSGMQSPKQQQLIKPNTVEFNSFLRNSLEQQFYDNNKGIKPSSNTNNININNMSNNNNNQQPRYYTNAVSSPTAANNSVSFQYSATTNPTTNRISSSPSYNTNTINTTFKQTNTIYKSNNNQTIRLSFNNDVVNQQLYQQQQLRKDNNNRLTIRVSPIKIGSCQQKFNNKSNRYSVDMCENYLQQDENYSENNNNKTTVKIVRAHNHQHHHHRVQKSSITIGQGFEFPINQNERNIIYITENIQPFSSMQSPKATQNILFKQDRSIEQQLYKEKMMKLKTKKSPKVRQVSEQKTNKSSTPSLMSKYCQKKLSNNTTNNITNNTNKSNKSVSKYTNRSIDRIEQLKKAHQVLKAKLSPNKEIKNIAKMSTMQTEENQHTKRNNNNNVLEINTNSNSNNNKQVQTKKQKSPISKLLSSQSLKTIESTKKLPKYIPKLFSKKQTNQTSNKDQQKQSSTSSIDRSSKKTIEKVQLMKQQPIELRDKMQSRKQVRGQVYLQDESEGVLELQQKQTDKYCNSNVKSIIKQITPSQQPTVSTRKQSSDESVGEGGRVRMMRRSSNKVYLQEEDNTEVGNTSNNNKRTTIEQRTPPSSNNIRNRPPITRVKNTNPTTQVRQKISSIQQIHMICQDYQQQQRQISITQRKQLYNQIYCLQQSKNKLK